MFYIINVFRYDIGMNGDGNICGYLFPNVLGI